MICPFLDLSVPCLVFSLTNVGEMAPASYENVNGVNYPNIPFYGNPKNTHKEKDNGLGKVDISNRFSVLQGLTEENQEKMLGSKPEIEEECEEGCEEECVEEGIYCYIWLSLIKNN